MLAGLLPIRLQPVIYVCLPARNHSRTVGLLLWKIRHTFTAFSREYQLLVADDASTDDTAEVLDLYQRVLPLTVIRNDPAAGYAASLERLLHEAVERSDRPKRDCAVIIPPDFAIPPDALPALVRRIESGADVVVGEKTNREGPIAMRLVCRSQPWLLRPGLRVPGLRDFISGCYAFRLATLKACFRDRTPLLDTEDWCANAELVARAALSARQIAAVALPPGRAAGASSLPPALQLAFALLRTGRRLRIPPPAVPVDRVA